jgi:hypothetical protein
MGTRMFDSMITQGHLVVEDEDLELTDSGAAFAAGFEIDLGALQKTRAPLCRECLDWSERRSHLAGSLGRAFLTRFEELSWAKRDQKTRVVSFSRTGAEAFRRLFPTDTT